MITGLLVLVVVGVIGGLGYTTYQLLNDRNSLRNEVAGLERENGLLARKNAQEKARVGQCAATKARVESRLREALDKITALEKEHETLARVLKELDALKVKSDNSEKKYKELVAQKMEVEQSRDGFAADLKELQQIHKQKMAEYEGSVNDLTAHLNSSNRQLDRCRDHNARLCIIGDNLAVMIQQKGGGLIKDPVFQTGRIEIEKMAQQYLEDIDKLKEKK